MVTPTNKKLDFNDEELKFVHRVYGQGNALEVALEMFAEARIDRVSIDLLPIGYVIEHAAPGPIIRIGWLDRFPDRPSCPLFKSDFDGSSRDLGAQIYLRGMKRVKE